MSSPMKKVGYSLILKHKTAPKWTKGRNDAVNRIDAMQNMIYQKLVELANFIAVQLDCGQTIFDWFASLFEPTWEKPDPRESNIR